MATRTDLGKWMITNGGEYDPDVVYERLTCVLYKNSTYLTLKTVTGVEPADDRVNYQLMAKGFAGSEFEIEGYVYVENEEIVEPAGEPMLNADKLGGELPEYYAPQREVSDEYSEETAYLTGAYCIYSNRLYRFIADKEAGSWDESFVTPVTIAEELTHFSNAVEYINTDLLSIWNLKNKYAHRITDGSDMKSDRYKIPGVYICNSDLIAQSLVNSPTGSRSFILLVYKALGENDNYITQEFRTYNNELYKRLWDGTGGGKWVDECKYFSSNVINKKLWEGSLSIGGIATIPEIYNYSIFKIYVAGNKSNGYVMAFRDGDNITGIGGNTSGTTRSSLFLLSISAESSSNQIAVFSCNQLYYQGVSSSVSEASVLAIYGLFKANQ